MKKKKIIIISLVVMLLVTSVITFSYAFWSMTNEQTTMNKLTSGCLSITLEGEDAISLNNAFPVTDEDGMKLKPYSFTITNTCDLFVSYNVSLEILKDSTLPIKYVRSMLNKEAVVNLNSLESTTTSIEGSIDSKILTSGSLGSGDSADYTLRIWMDEDVTVNDTDAINKTLLSKVTVTAVPSSYSPVANGFTNLAEALLVNEYQTTNVDVANSKIASKQEVIFSETAPAIIWKEKHGTEVTQKTLTKADPALIGQYGIVEKTTQIVFANSYTFNSTSGYYTLGERVYYDPVNVDFSSDDYYFCGSGLNATAENTILPTNSLTCSVLSKVISYESVNDVNITLYEGDKINGKQHTFKIYQYGVEELESDKSDKGLYESVDDYGTTYYYRGNVSNNYVKFAGFYWKVVRINGDGSVRLIYSGTNINSQDNTANIGASKYNTYRDNPTYIGYMYSNDLSINYENSIKSDNNSTIKNKIDNWYKNNIESKGYSSYVADSGFCNDRTLASDSLSDGNNVIDTITYAGYNRVYKGITPSFKCQNTNNDLFTLNGSTIGNGKLTYPVGTITADEALYAGLVQAQLNTLNYLFTGDTYWTMTPLIYASALATSRIMTVNAAGAISYGAANGGYAVRPVINLKADTEIAGGIGTKNDPFVVK